MIKNIFVLILCFVLSGCVMTANYQLYEKYSKIYGDSLNAGSVTTIVNKESYPAIKQPLSDCLTSLGYTKVIFENPSQGFIVLAKAGRLHPPEIILKYTAMTGEYKTSIDLVDASDDVNTNNDVPDDIQNIANQLEKTWTH